MVIVGAGMSGLLAAHMLRRFQPRVFEAQGELPNNHAAVLRFRSDVVSRATGIPFKKVWVQKALSFEGNLYDSASIKFQNMYSAKVTGKIAPRSIMNLNPGERWVAPEDFIQQMARGIDISYHVPMDKGFIQSSRGGSGKALPLISTIPMPALMDLADWKDAPKFHHQSIAIFTVDIPGCEVYQTIYYPGSEWYYRASITGSKLMIELAEAAWFGVPEGHKADIARQMADKVMDDFGLSECSRSLPSLKEQQFGKIISVNNHQRKQFVLAMTDKYNIYALGRFATWRQLLMDDVCADVKLIEQMITERSSYVSHLQSA